MVAKLPLFSSWEGQIAFSVYGGKMSVWKNVLKNFQMSEQYWGCSNKMSEANFSPAETLTFCCHGNQSSDLIWTKTLCSLSLTPMILQMKFDFNQPAGLRDIHVWKSEQTDRRWLEYHPISSPGAFGSGELKKEHGVFIGLHKQHFCVLNC